MEDLTDRPPVRPSARPPVRPSALPLGMADTNVLEITPELSIPLSELEYRASRSGGPGGQHVNTSSTRVEVWWDVAGSAAPTADQRERLVEKLGSPRDSHSRARRVAWGA